jgi:hypothetical protein
MKVMIEGSPKEIVDLVVEVRGRLKSEKEIKIMQVKALREIIDFFGFEDECINKLLHEKEIELGLR